MANEIRIKSIASGYDLGEGPHWIERDQSLIFVDIFKGNLHRYFSDSGRIQTLHLQDVGTGKNVPFIVPVDGSDSCFAVGVGRTLCTVKWLSSDPDYCEKKPFPLSSVDDDVIGNAFNDAKCDPSGRLWAGTLDAVDFGVDIGLHKGSLYKFDETAKASKMAGKITIANGLAWSNNRKTFYYIDTMDNKVDAYDFDLATGSIGNKKCVIDFKAPPVIEGMPDGMTIDADGNLWVACFGSAQVICIDPNVGKVIRKVAIPSKQTTSCCFGGPAYSTLYVTSANLNISQDELSRFPKAGDTFAVTGLNTKGLQPDEYKLDKKYWNSS